MLRRIFVMLLLGLASVAAEAQSVTFKRGVSTGTWIDPPGPADMTDSAVIAAFPDWERSVSPSEIRSLKNAGFDFVRFTIDPAIFFVNDQPYERKVLLDGVAAGITAIRKADLNVIVDLHTIPRGDGVPDTLSLLADAAQFEKYLQLVADIGKVVSRFDSHAVAFEPFNEPVIDCPWDGGAKAWPKLLNTLHATARKAAPNHSLVLQGACWGGAGGLASIDPRTLKDDNIIWSFHTFAPMIFTHQGATWTPGAEAFVSGLTFPPDPLERRTVVGRTVQRIRNADTTYERKLQLLGIAEASLGQFFSPGSELEQMREPVDIVAAWAEQYNIPGPRILVGEFGVIRDGVNSRLPDTVRARYMKVAREMYEAQGWGWSVWSWGGSFAVVESDNNRRPSANIMLGLGLKP